MTSRDFGFLTLRNTTAYQPNGNPVPPNNVFVTSTNGLAFFSDNISINTVNVSTASAASIIRPIQQYDSTISNNFGKNILLRSSTISTVNLLSSAPNDTFINFINGSGANYNIITTGPISNNLSTNTLLTGFYTNIDGLGWIAPSFYTAATQPPPVDISSMAINIYVSSATQFSTLTLPFGGISSINVSWGNGQSTLNATTAPTNSYSTIGNYTIKISGSASSFGNDIGYTGAYLISSVSQWGTLGFSSLKGAFFGASNLVSVPTDIPSTVSDLSGMFIGATKFNDSNISLWSTSNVTNMGGMFSDASSFNQPLNDWNVSKVMNMEGMFSEASSFNQPINNWNVSKVMNMKGMFFQATTFNQSLNNWSTSNVSTMSNMFADATSFNQPINNWNVSSVSSMAYMFQNASSFNRALSNWSTLKVSSMEGMFQGASSFNQDLSMWNVSTVSTANYIFCNSPGMLANSLYWPPFITIPMPIWGCSLDPMIINISTMPGNLIMSLPFHIVTAITVDWGDTTIQQFTTPPIAHTYSVTGYYPIKVTGHASTFGDQVSPAGYIGVALISSVSQWGTIGLTSLSRAFNNAVNLVGVPSYIPASVTNMDSMFTLATSFNQDISSWSTSNVTTMIGMFSQADNFNQPLNTWNTSSVTNMGSMFLNASSFNQNISNWSTSNVTTMSFMFQNASSFDQPLNTWNTINVKNMHYMFNNALLFNQPLNTWNTINVKNMYNMFEGASSFNQNLSMWNVLSVIDADYIFCNCPMSTLANASKRPNITYSGWISSCN